MFCVSSSTGSNANDFDIETIELNRSGHSALTQLNMELEIKVETAMSVPFFSISWRQYSRCRIRIDTSEIFDRTLA